MNKTKNSSVVKQENGARHQIMEDLFFDFNKSWAQVYKINFFRGVFFGFGTVLGSTVLVAFLIWLLGQFAGWVPFIGDSIDSIIKAFQR